jgi:ribosomal protein S18 acetylase RimI-like enzyme
MITESIIIRKAKIGDVPQLIELGIDLMKYHEKLDSYFKMAKNAKSVYKIFFRKCIIDNKRRLLVAEYNNKIIGYALGSLKLRAPVLKVRRVGRINDLFVKSGFRRQKVGKKLFSELIKWFRFKKINDVDLGVHVNNEIGKKTWGNYGFKTFKLEQKIRI